MANSMNNMRMLLVVGIVLTLGYLVYTSLVQPTQTAPIEVESAPVVEEGFQVNDPANNATVTSEDLSLGQETVVDASEPLGENAQPKGLQEVESTTMNQLPSECYPKDVLSSAELLPQDANTLYAQVNPSGQGSLQDQNFLTAGYHIGINTVGQSLRNANRQLRSEPPNPQVKVSPWLQTTIEPDINRKPLEIGGDQ